MTNSSVAEYFHSWNKQQTVLVKLALNV